MERLSLHLEKHRQSEEAYTALVAEVHALRSVRMHKLWAAFALGLLSIPLGLFLMRLLPSFRSRSPGYTSLLVAPE